MPGLTLPKEPLIYQNYQDNLQDIIPILVILINLLKVFDLENTRELGYGLVAGIRAGRRCLWLAGQIAIAEIDLSLNLESS